MTRMSTVSGVLCNAQWSVVWHGRQIASACLHNIKKVTRAHGKRGSFMFSLNCLCCALAHVRVEYRPLATNTQVFITTANTSCHIVQTILYLAVKTATNTLEEDKSGTGYAILSHRWFEEKVTSQYILTNKVLNRWKVTQCFSLLVSCCLLWMEMMYRQEQQFRSLRSYWIHGPVDPETSSWNLHNANALIPDYLLQVQRSSQEWTTL